MAVPNVVLYDATGTEVPLPGDPNPPQQNLVPEGVNQTQRDRYRGYPSRNLTPAKIINILANADAGWPLEWIELCEEIVEKDPKIGSVLHTRTAAVLGLYYEIQPPKLDEIDTAQDPVAQEIARFCDQALLACNFTELVGDLLDAVGKPFAIDWVDWALNRDGKVVPLRFRRIPTKHIHWAFDSDTVRVYDPYAVYVSAPKDGNLGEPLPPYTTVRAVYNTRRDHPTRAGLLRSLVWYYHFKAFGLKDLAAYLDRYGMPLRVIQADDQDLKNDAFLASMRAALANMGSDASGVISKNSNLIIEQMATKGGSEVFSTMIDYVDKAIAQLVLGHELSSQGSAGGGLLGISAALQVRQDILEADCNFVSSVIKRDVLTPLIGWNFGWDQVHLTPNLTYNYEPPKDLVAQANVMSVVASTFPDLTFSKQQIRDEYGFDEPLGEEADPNTPEDDVLVHGGAAGAAGAQGPGAAPKSPDPSRGTPEVSINSLARYTRPRRGRMAPKFKPSRQRRVDRIASYGISLGQSIVDGWRKQIATAVRDAQDAGVPLYEVRQRILKLYPELDATVLQQTIAEASLKSRLYGRNAV